MKKLQITVSALGIVILGAIFYFNASSATYLSFCMSVICTVIFAVLCLRFLPVWIGEWSGGINKENHTDEPENMEIKIFVLLVLWDIFIILLHFAMHRMISGNVSFADDLNFWNFTDSCHYIDIARDGYLSYGDWDRLVQLVFLPGYPMVIGLLNKLVGNYLYSAMIASGLCFALSGVVLYRLARLDYCHSDAIRTVKYFCILPAAFFFVAPMSESLFVLCCLSCVYFVRKNKITLGCLFGGMAAFTRSLGIVLVALVLFDFIGEFIANRNVRDFMKKCANLLLIPFGFGLYCFINYQVSGEFFQFMEYQKVHWNQSFGWFFNTASYQTEYAMGTFADNPHNFFGLWLPNLIAIFSALIIITLAVKKIKGGYTAFFIGYFIISIGATWLLSAPRYMIGCFVLPIAISQITKNKKADFCISIVCLIGYILYFSAFLNRWQVW